MKGMMHPVLAAVQEPLDWSCKGNAMGAHIRSSEESSTRPLSFLKKLCLFKQVRSSPLNSL